MQKTVIYCRKSTESDEKQVQSLDDQRNELRDFVSRFNGGFVRSPEEALKVVEVLTESFSAKQAGRRTVFNQVMANADNGKYDCILVWSIDRISRNVGDIERIISLLESGKIKQVRTPSQEFKNEPFHKYMLVQAVANAKLENDQKGVNVVRGLKSKIRDGNWIGWARIGYKNFGDKKGKRWVDKDPERFDIIRHCWEKLATGVYSMPDVKREAEKLGLRARPTKAAPEGSMVGINTYYDLFRDVFYIGKMRVGSSGRNSDTLKEAKAMILKGEIEGEIHDDYVIVNGNHPPMVSEELFYRVQEVLKERGLAHHYSAPKIKDFLFAGMIQCGNCHCAVVTEEKTKYKCTHCKKWFTCSTSKPVPTHCKYCKEQLSKHTLENSFYYCYAHCSGKNKERKICAQTHYKTGRGKPSVQVSELEQQVDELLSNLTMDEAVYDYCLETLKGEHFQKRILENKALTLLQRDHKLISTKLDNLLEMRLSGEIDSELFTFKKEDLKKKQKEVMGKLEKFNQRNTDWVEQTENFLNTASRARKAFQNGNNEIKREILKSIGSHIFLEGGKLRFELRKPFDVLLIPQFDDTDKKAQKALSTPQFHEWLPGPDSNRRPID